MTAGITARLTRLRTTIKEENLQGYLVLNAPNRYYLSGFTGSAGMVLVTAKRAVLLTDFRYTEQASKEAGLFEIIDHGPAANEKLIEILHNEGVKRVGLGHENVTVAQFNALNKRNGIEFVPVFDLVPKIRAVKDSGEVAKIRHAAQIADEALQEIIPQIASGQREIDISLDLEFKLRKRGAQKAAFDFIVASGVRSSLPHGVASVKALEKGDFVTIDFGAMAEWYNSDMTRTLVIGEPTPKHRDIYNIVLEAQLAAINYIAPGKRCCDVDKVARDIIAKAGYGDYFGHSLGHGVGLAVHEEPALSTKNETVLQTGMVVTVEPGIYLPGWGGVRIEDMVLVSDEGCEVLTHTAKEMLII